MCGVTNRDEDAATDVCSDKDRSSQKRTCERVSKVGPATKKIADKRIFKKVRTC